MEDRFGHDFSRVRVHTDARSAESANAVGALAYTVRNHIVFGAGEYAPETTAGRRLLAHELAHVVQQGASTERTGIQRAVSPELGGEVAVQRTAEDGLGVASGLTRGRTTAVQRVEAEQCNPPSGLRCSTGTTSPVGGYAVQFGQDVSSLSSDQKGSLANFVRNWHASGANTSVRLDGYASPEGACTYNWRLSCSRAMAVAAELVSPSDPSVGPGIPSHYISIYAHGETTEFSSTLDPNRQVVISLGTSPTPPVPPTSEPPTTETPPPPEGPDRPVPVPPTPRVPIPLIPPIPAVPTLPIPPISPVPPVPTLPPVPDVPEPSEPEPSEPEPSETTLTCGPDVTSEVVEVIDKTTTEFESWDPDVRDRACKAISIGWTSLVERDPDRGGTRVYLNAWDIVELHVQDWISEEYSPPCAIGDRCRNSVTVDGECFYAGSANYVIFGVMYRLCRNHFTISGPVRFSEGAMKGLIRAYKGPVPILRSRPAGNYQSSKEWAKSGYNGWRPGGSTPSGDRSECARCSEPYTGPAFTVYWYPRGRF
jgi:outer membrane protein OmpA-like peptidoglycan-associated protein